MSLLTDDEEEFAIDRFKLDKEAERNGKMMRHYGKRLAIASAKVKDEKRILGIIEVEEVERILKNPKAYGLTKTTDKYIFPIAQKQEAYIKQFNRYLIAYRREKDLESAVATVSQRGFMITILKDLWKDNYYSHPPVDYSERKPIKKIVLKKDINY